MTTYKAKAYARLLKLNVPELSLYPLIAFGLTSSHLREPRYWRCNLVFLAYSFCCATLAIALDDIMGYVDGVDRLVQLGAKRNIAKPLLEGDLSLAEAKAAAGALAALALALSIALAHLSRHPAVAALLLLVLLAGVVQYSFGLKLSYVGLGEAVIVFGAAMTTALPCWILEGALRPRVAWTAAMAGLPYAAQIVISNVVDHDSDRASQRNTLTVLVGPRRAPWVSAAILGVFWALFAAGLGAGALPRVALLWLVLLPPHLRFLQLAFGGQASEARLLSFQGIRLQLATFTIAFLAAALVPALG